MCWCLKLYIYIMDGVVFDIWKFYLQTQKNKTLKKKPNFLKKKEKQKGLFFIFFFIIVLLLDSFFLLIQLEINKSKQ